MNFPMGTEFYVYLSSGNKFYVAATFKAVETANYTDILNDQNILVVRVFHSHIEAIAP